MKRIEIKSLAVGLALGVVVCLGVAATPGRKSGLKEYKLIEAQVAAMEGEMNKAAGQGWDLVSCGPLPTGRMLTVMAREVR